MSEHDVLVVGLGPVGATAANLAGSLGLDCLGADASESVFGLPRAIHFDADVMRVFQAIGLSEQVQAICRPGSGSLHLGSDGEPIRDFRVEPATGDLGWYPHYMFYQPQLDQLLRDGAERRSNVELALGWRCERVSQDRNGTVAVLRHPSGREREVRARYLLACDGASSTVRRQLGIGLRDFGFEEAWIVADMLLPSADLGPDHMVTSCDPRRPIVYVPGPRNHRRWEFMVLPGEDPELMSQPDRMRSVIEPSAPWLGEAEVVRSAVYTFHGLVAKSWTDRAIFLAGDAAHQTPPFYAQGMCHGIRDVRNLLWKLAMVLRGEAAPALLESYQAEREPHVSTIIEAAVENGRYICMLDPEMARRRDASYREMMRKGTDVGSFRRVIPGLVSGLIDGEGPRPEAVGESFPQPLVAGSDGRERLLDEVLGPGFAVVTSSAEPLPPDSWPLAEMGGPVVTIATGAEPRPGFEPVADLDGSLADWFERNGCEWAVVRPDRYVFGVAGGRSGAVRLLDRLRETLAGTRPLARAIDEPTAHQLAQR